MHFPLSEWDSTPRYKTNFLYSSVYETSIYGHEEKSRWSLLILFPRLLSLDQAKNAGTHGEALSWQTRAVPGKERKIREAVCTARHEVILRRVINSSGCSRLWKCCPAFFVRVHHATPSLWTCFSACHASIYCLCSEMHWWDLIFRSVAGDSPHL